MEDSILFLSSFLLFYSLFVCALLGGALGSFVCCYADRKLHGQSALKGRSHCDACGHTLSPLDLVPVLSFLLLKGKCRYCGAKIGREAFYAECGMAVICMAFLLRYDISFAFLRAVFFAAVLLAVSLIDAKSYTIPDSLIFMGIFIWALFIPFGEEGPAAYIKEGLLGGFAISVFLLLFSLLADRILKKESMGGGDIKLFFVTGLYVGLAQNLLNLILSCIAGIIVGLWTMRGSENNGEELHVIPFGPAIAQGTVVTMLIGEKVCAWYFSLF